MLAVVDDVEDARTQAAGRALRRRGIDRRRLLHMQRCVRTRAGCAVGLPPGDLRGEITQLANIRIRWQLEPLPHPQIRREVFRQRREHALGIADRQPQDGNRLSVCQFDLIGR